MVTADPAATASSQTHSAITCPVTVCHALPAGWVSDADTLSLPLLSAAP
jgi:hypothetical protein